MAASRKVIDDIVRRNEVVYGVNTGFGKLADVRIPRGEIEKLQLNLVRSHACGIGNPLSEPEVRVMMLLRANVLTLGFSGIPGEADDIVQETLWSFWRHAARWKGDGPPLAAYLAKIAMNRAIDSSRLA